MLLQFYSMKDVLMSDILGYLNDFAKNKNGRIIHWQVIETRPERAFPPENARYTCIIEFEVQEQEKEIA